MGGRSALQMKTLLLLLCAICANAMPNRDLYTKTPFGHILTHCTHEVPENSHLVAQEDGSTKVLTEAGQQYVIPACDTRNGTLSVRLSRPLPPDYDGWLQYTAVNVSKLGLTGGFDAFTNLMSVPDKPKQAADQLFLFPGLQNIDWIPKVDPEPTESNPFDIIQPVLQYPSSSFFHSKEWELKSWYVTVNSGAIYSSGVNVDAGDSILCNMTRTGEDSWVVIGTLNGGKGKTQRQSATNARLKLQPWAYNTLECYGCTGCDTYPTKPITFTDNKLYQAGKQVDVPGSSWAVNPKPAAKLKCHEKTAVAANGDTTISFQ